MYKLNFIPSPGATPLPIYHPNGANEIDKLIIIEPGAHLEVNTAGSMHFDLNPEHPYIGNITIMKGVLELLDGSVPIFRGRVTRDSQSFYLRHQLSAEGMLACLNDSIVPPFNFPEDWEDDAGYQAAAASGNVVQFFLKWLLENHNANVGAEQQIKLGSVTVTDPNNYITRSSEKYENTWQACKDKLFGSSLGGYFLMRYEADGNYLDYVDDFPLTNVQKVAFAENLLDLNADRDGIDLYTAILPVGKDELTIAELPDESIDSDLVKSGKIIYSKSAEQTQGGRITKTFSFDDVTEPGNLRSKAAAMLAGVALPETISCNACDLHGIDGETPSFRVGRYTEVYSRPHGYSSTYPLMALDLDILNPGNTPIVLNRQQMSLTRTIGSAAAIKAAQAAAAAAQRQLEDFSTSTLATMADMQDQIDGSIESWFENYDPTTGNEPANTWTTAALKNQHLGDLFYNSTTGHAFRWQQNGTAYEWKLIPDTDATKALADAAKAQDTADGKRRVFYTTPTPPYDKGDLWAGGSTGDLKVCNTAKASGKSYAASDWVLATKYTDNALAQAAMDAFDNMEVGGRNLVKTSNPFYVSPAVSANAYVDGETLILNYADSSIDTYFELRLWENLVANQEYTLSFDCQGVEDGKAPRYFISGASNSKFELFNGRVVNTFVLSADKASPYLLLDDTGTRPTNTNITLSKVKLEIGNVPTDWSRAPEDVDARIDEVVSTTREYAAGIVSDSQSVMLEAMSKYTEHGTFSAYQEELEAKLKVLDEGIEARVSRTEVKEITDAQGDVQKRVDTIEKFIKFDADDGMTIGQEGSNVKQVLGNDSQKIIVNGQVVQELNAADGARYTSAKIEKRLQLGNLIIYVEADGSLAGRRAN